MTKEWSKLRLIRSGSFSHHFKDYLRIGWTTNTFGETDSCLGFRGVKLCSTHPQDQDQRRSLRGGSWYSTDWAALLVADSPKERPFRRGFRYGFRGAITVPDPNKP